MSNAESTEHFERGVALHGGGDLTGAIDAYIQALKASPHSPTIHNNLGLALCEQGFFENGIAQFRMGLRRHPDDADLLNNLGCAYLNLGQSDAAVHYLIHAVSLRPRDADIHASLGMALIANGRHGDASEHFEIAHNLDPGNEEANRGLDQIRTLVDEPNPYTQSVNPHKSHIPDYLSILTDEAPDAPLLVQRGSRERSDPLFEPVIVSFPILSQPIESDVPLKRTPPKKRERSKPKVKAAARKVSVRKPKLASEGRQISFALIVVIVLALHFAGLAALALLHGTVTPTQGERTVHIVSLPPVAPDTLPAPPLGELNTTHPRHIRHSPHPTPNEPTRTRALATKALPAEVAQVPEPKTDVPLFGPDDLDAMKRVEQSPGNVALQGPAEAGDAPNGFPNGKIDGRVYFIRLKHDIGPWDAHEAGSAALLSFMNAYFKCETVDRPMTAAEISDKYTSKGAMPSFLYIYCDDQFSLTNSEAAILSDYIQKGGFLFIDSLPDDITHDVVAQQLAKIIPTAPMVAIPPSHPINSFLFHLKYPGNGENFSGQTNYGVTIGDRLVAFYSPGNLFHIYENHTPDSDDYTRSQYQMGANVVAYAVNHGISAAIAQHDGATGAIVNEPTGGDTSAKTSQATGE